MGGKNKRPGEGGPGRSIWRKRPVTGVFEVMCLVSFHR
jgi:hypothetical protein